MVRGCRQVYEGGGKMSWLDSNESKTNSKAVSCFIAFLLIGFFIVVFVQIGIWHGRKLERQDIAHTNKMWNEMVACFKIKEMYEPHIKYQKNKALEKGGKDEGN